MHGKYQPRHESGHGIGEPTGEQREQGGGEAGPEHIHPMEPVGTRADLIVQRVGRENQGSPQRPTETDRPVGLLEHGAHRGGMLQQRSLGDYPAIVRDESIADGGGGDGHGQKARHEGGLPRRHSHSIVAGGLELTS